ncbi:hypothetical protein [Streptomyces sasae]|uniref:hypothetical protein n=1 Tax=Streptomyces sasae TaxID=1266772 RepID=UPI00292E758E|nr:hypothetical protein [Streptomyces sasae]
MIADYPLTVDLTWNGTALGTSDWISMASAAIAAASLLYTRIQARAAKRANTTAEAANRLSREANAVSAEANETAKQALGLAREQFDAERQAQHEAAGPKFEIESAEKENVGEWFAHIKIRQVDGATLETARVTVSGEYVRGLRWSKHSDEWLPQPVDWDMPAPGTTFKLCVELEHEHVGPPNVGITLDCRAADGRTWQRTYTAQPVQLPPEPYLTRRQRRAQ